MIIKSVVTALPNHVMSCYRLPKATTKKLTSAVAQFGWSPGKAQEECIGNHGTKCVLARRKGDWGSKTSLISTQPCLVNSYGD